MPAAHDLAVRRIVFDVNCSMSFSVWLLFLVGAAIGHFALALWLFNRLHAQSWPYRFRQFLERLLVLATAVVPLLVVVTTWNVLLGSATNSNWHTKNGEWLSLGWLYGGLCWTVLVASIPLWLWPKLTFRVPGELIANDSRVVDLRSLTQPTVQGAFPQFCASLPGNGVFQLHVQTKHLRLPTLPPELSGLRIAHLTDLHLTGKIGQEYFAESMRLTNELKPDLIAMTGDIAERTKCLPWIKPLFGSLQAPLGKYYVLGNHDFLLPDANELRTELASAGFVELRGTTQRIQHNGGALLLAGNELPWCGPAPDVPPRDDAFRLLLAHTPDLFYWAQSQDFDLMLAGHNHGGQICFPLIGPLVSPSRYGTRYAGGVFREGPTLMHVGRGLSGEHLLRWNCPPELTLLVLEAA
jgi:predicted MPP superfamily phosphohydrolase